MSSMEAFIVIQNWLLQSTQPSQKLLEYLLLEITQAIELVTEVLYMQSSRYLILKKTFCQLPQHLLNLVIVK